MPEYKRPVLRMKKAVHSPEPLASSGISIRDFNQEQHDIANWLALYSRAMPPTGSDRSWTEVDFRREFISRRWWSAERMMFAEEEDPPATKAPIGVIAWGDTSVAEDATIKWLLVSPDYQRQRVATRLLCELERRCATAKRKRIVLETLPSWTSAVAFYRARGFSEY